MIKIWQEELRKAANPEKIKIFMSFFKTGKGEYGEGDKFIGLSVPENRRIARKYLDADFNTIDKMIQHEIHEFRLSGFICLVEKYKRSKSQNEQNGIVEFYVTRGTSANNWDLVDLSAPYILGENMLNSPNPILLDQLSFSDDLWLQRIAIVSTLTLIRKKQFDDALRLSERYLSHSHPLIHKATGWILREIGKKDEAILFDFLENYAPIMPRTALRYAIERLSPEQRQHFMHKK